jgi:hypothetical protein
MQARTGTPDRTARRVRNGSAVRASEEAGNPPTRPLALLSAEASAATASRLRAVPGIVSRSRRAGSLRDQPPARTGMASTTGRVPSSSSGRARTGLRLPAGDLSPVRLCFAAWRRRNECSWGSHEPSHPHDLLRFRLRMIPLDRDLLSGIGLWMSGFGVCGRLSGWSTGRLLPISHHLLALVRAISYASMRMASSRRSR